jgi:hypothetical protein
MSENLDLATFLKRQVEQLDAKPPKVPADAATRGLLLQKADSAALAYRDWYLWTNAFPAWARNKRFAPPAVPGRRPPADDLNDLWSYLSPQERELATFWVPALRSFVGDVATLNLRKCRPRFEPFLVGKFSGPGFQRGEYQRVWIRSDKAPQGALRVADGFHEMEKVFFALKSRLMGVDIRSVDYSTIVFLGNGMYRIADNPPLQLTANESNVLEAFLKHAAMDLSRMQEESGVPRCRDVLRKLRTKYKGVFAPAITMPGAKGQGGYRVRIVSRESTTLRDS